MAAIKSGLFLALFLVTVLGPASLAAATEPVNPCLMMPKVTYGQGRGAKTGYQPKTCIT